MTPLFSLFFLDYTTFFHFCCKLLKYLKYSRIVLVLKDSSQKINTLTFLPHTERCLLSLPPQSSADTPLSEEEPLLFYL